MQRLLRWVRLPGRHAAAAWGLAVIGPVLITLGGRLAGSSVPPASILSSTLVVVVIVALLGGVRPLLLAVLVGLLAQEVLFEFPYGSLADHKPAQLTVLAGFVVSGAVIGVLVDRLTRLTEEQSALRRVAALVVGGALPEDLFAAIAAEVGRFLPVEVAGMGRFEPDGVMTEVAGWSATGRALPAVGSRWALGGRNAPTLVSQTGRPVRTDSPDDNSGPLGALIDELGLRSFVAVPITVDGQLWGNLGVASTLDKPLPPDTETRLAAFTDLLATAIANAESRARLAASRARVVAAADEARRQIERDLHDGAQQRLVTLGLEVRAAQAAMPPELGALRADLSRVAEGLTGMLEEIRELAQGIHPAILAEGGLGAALKRLGRRSPVPVQLDARIERRLPERVEIATYFVVAEALTNAAKHAHASAIRVEVAASEHALRVSVCDDGVGGADESRGSGLIGLRDRIEALDGAITVRSFRGSGTSLHVELPLDHH
jgi:signal transduction histidine kinase